MIYSSLKIAESKKFPQKELNDINIVRLYLEVTTLSDITISDGSKIKNKILEGERYTCCISVTYWWPRIPKPTRIMVKTWERAVKLTFTSENLQVRENMKRNIWSNNSKDKHIWWFVKVENRIYQKIDDIFQIWIPNGRNSRRIRYKKVIILN